MDFRSNTEGSAFVEDVQTFFAEHLTPEILARVDRDGTLHDDGLHKALASRRWIGASWPEELGGLGMDPAEFSAFWEIAQYCRAPVDGQLVTEMVGLTIARLGTDELKQAILPRIVAGEVLISLGYTEPDSGSDVAAAKTTAVRVDGGYQINGSKMFTTVAHIADYVFLLARTDPTVSKHRGLTMFLVPTSAPGVEVRAVETFGGERTNATFYDNVFVPDNLRVGAENDGWRVVLTALDVERASIRGYVGQARRLLDDLLEALEGDPGRLEASGMRSALSAVNVQIEASRALADRVFCAIAKGEIPSAEAAMFKLLVTDMFKDLSHLALDLVGPAALLTGASSGALVGGHLEHSFRHAQIATIYGGSNEIQRNIIAGRALKLPAA